MWWCEVTQMVQISDLNYYARSIESRLASSVNVIIYGKCIIHWGLNKITDILQMTLLFREQKL